MSSTTNTKERPVVFFDINIGETPAGRMKMELFSDIVPKYGIFHLMDNLYVFIDTCLAEPRKISDSFVLASIGTSQLFI